MHTHRHTHISIKMINMKWYTSICIHTHNIHAYCIDLWVNVHVHMLTQRYTHVLIYTHRHRYTSMYEDTCRHT